MPSRVPQFTRSVSPTNSRQSNISLSGNSPGQGLLRRAANSLFNRGGQVKDEEQRRADAQWASETAAKFRRDELTRFNEAKLTDDTIEGFNSRYMETFDTSTETLLETAPTSAAQSLLRSQLTAFGVQMHQSALGFEAQQRVLKRFTSLTESIDVMANNAFTNTNNYEIELKAAEEMVDIAGDDLPPAKQSELKALARNRITRGYLKGVIGQDPYKAKEMLEAGDFDEDLSASNREALLSGAETEIRRQEAKVASERKATYLQLKEIIKDNVDVLVAGHDASQLDGIDEALKRLGGAEEVELRAVLNNAKELGKQMRNFVLLPPTVQQDVHNQMAQKMREGKITPQQLELYEAMGKAIDYRDRRVKDDALSYAVEVGIIDDYTPLNFADKSTLSRRGQQARSLEAHFGSKAMPFTEAELSQFLDMYTNADTDTRRQLLTTLSMEWHPSLIKKFAQKIGPNNPTLAFSMAVAPDRPAVSRLIMRGQSKLDNLPEFKQSRQKYAAIFSEEIGSMFSDRPQHHRMVIDSALAIYMERSNGEYDENGPDKERMREALRLTLGGEIINGEVVGGDLTFNGQRLVSPVAGLSADQFDKEMRNLQDVHLWKYGKQYNRISESYEEAGSPVLENGESVSAGQIQEFGRLRGIGDGKYLVAYANGFLLTGSGQPYVLDLKGYFNNGSWVTLEDINEMNRAAEGEEVP